MPISLGARGVRAWLVTLTALCVLLRAGESRAQEWSPHWSTRLALAAGVPMPSAHEALLYEDTYSDGLGMRFAGSLEVSRSLNRRFGLGVRGEYGFRDAASKNPHRTLDAAAPNYEEQFVDVAARLPITLWDAPKVVFQLTPFAGWGAGTGYFYSAGRLQSALLLGLELNTYFPRAHLGFGGGVDTLRVGARSAVDASNDFGMIYFNVLAGFDVKS